MATTTHRGITYTGTGTYTITANMDLGLWAGNDESETLWLDGQATAGYPGNLDGFQATNTQVTDRRSPRLIGLSLSDALADGNTLTLSGECSKILMAIGSHKDATAIMGTERTGDLEVTFQLKQHDDSAADTSEAELLLVVV